MLCFHELHDLGFWPDKKEEVCFLEQDSMRVPAAAKEKKRKKMQSFILAIFGTAFL